MSTQSADLIITGGQIWTGNLAEPRAQAVAVSGKRILSVGRHEDVFAWRGPFTSILENKGTLLPGFIDSHYHLLLGAEQLDHLALDDVSDYGDLRRALWKYAGEHPELDWINGIHLSYTALPEGEEPRIALDGILADRPVVLMAFDCHTAWANTKALELTGALHGMITPENSTIVMGDNGLATGELREPAAYGLVLRKVEGWKRLCASLGGLQLVERPDPVRERTLLQRAVHQAAQYGITSVQNMDGNAGQMMVYTALEDSGELTLRVNVPFSVYPSTRLQDLQEAVWMREQGSSELVKGGRVKIFMDGVVESWTALLSEDYADRPGSRGNALYSLEEFTLLAQECDRLGLQISVHAIGDAAVRQTLDGLEMVQRSNGRRDSRHRIEHIELIRGEDLPRFAESGVLASMQPLHGPQPWLGKTEAWTQRISPGRWKDAFAWQRLREQGARIVFGSDWPVVTQRVLSSLHAACGRQPWRAGLENQKQSLEDSLAAFGRDAAYAEFQEGEKGQIKPGMVADLVLLDRDLSDTPIEDLEKVDVTMTLFNGQVVFEK